MHRANRDVRLFGERLRNLRCGLDNIAVRLSHLLIEAVRVPAVRAGQRFMRLDFAVSPVEQELAGSVPHLIRGLTHRQRRLTVDVGLNFQAASNIAIHMPDDCIGIDVDHYNGKIGGATLAQLEQELGPLPPTYISTARNGGVSGIRWFRTEPGLRWPTGPWQRHRVCPQGPPLRGRVAVDPP